MREKMPLSRKAKIWAIQRDGSVDAAEMKILPRCLICRRLGKHKRKAMKDERGNP